MKKTKFDRFELINVKLKKDGGGLDGKYQAEDKIGDEVYHDTKTIDSDKIPHADLTSKLELFKENIMEVYGYSVLLELINSNVFMPSEKQIEILREKYNGIKNKITVTGISLSGKDQNKGVIITAKLKVDTGQHVAINTQRLKFTGKKYGFEENMQPIVDDLEREVFEYEVNNKMAQLSLIPPNTAEQETDDDLVAKMGKALDGDAGKEGDQEGGK